ncbi:MAG TPA: small secreted hydrophilic protein, partial [Candidatus Poseidoniales archaeon]
PEPEPEPEPAPAPRRSMADRYGPKGPVDDGPANIDRKF